LNVMLATLLLTAPAALAGGDVYAVHNLVSSGPPLTADHTDPNLVNPWGIAFNPTAFAWVADNHSGVSTLYDGAGNPQTLVVTIPNGKAGGQGSPTGIVFNATKDFSVSKDTDSGPVSGPAAFLFATEGGIIAGWNPTVDGTNAMVAVDNGGSAIYKGLALGADGTQSLLFATDFHNARVDVFDPTFKPVTTDGGFADPKIPDGFAPFGIQNIGGDIYVTYAMQDADAEDDVAGKGLGFVDVFNTHGVLIRRLISRKGLNAPWGLALAPAGFGKFAGQLLVGNFGDGTIAAYDLASGKFRGRMEDSAGDVIQIEGLWALVFGNGYKDQPTDALFFTAGPADETEGLYGRIDPAAREKKPKPPKNEHQGDDNQGHPGNKGDSKH
jgi:uncharacterized protein (TIGR03118 family)